MINAHLPLNSLSLGFCSLNILQQFYNRSVDVNLFHTQSPPDFAAYNISEDFSYYLSKSADKAKKTYSKKDPCLRIWHINNAENSLSERQTLLTFHEVDNLTPTEINILKNQEKVLVSSRFSLSLMESFGINAVYCPLGFDKTHFKKTNRKYNKEGLTSFSIFGKFEKRKHHQKAIQAWISKYGNNQKYLLNLHVYNPFFSAEQNNAILNNVFGGQKPFNVNVLPFVKTLNELNDSFNACDIVLDMSGGEGWSIPSFTAIGLGKHGVVHNCSSIKDWAKDSGAVLIQPNGKEPVYDGTFFQQGGEFNQGNIFTWDKEEFIEGCEQALKNFQSNPVNEKGLLLQDVYSWEKTTDIILDNLK